jgi:serine/threonine protein kinase
MKSCPKCQRVYPNDAGFCPADGTGLVFTSMVPVATSSEDRRIGAKLCGRYEIRRVVADGGMGRVYEGVDKQTDTRVAVKVLHDDVAKDEVARERFKREYEISANLPHDYIVNVLDFQRDDEAGVWLLVMEYLDGEELRIVLKREKTIPSASSASCPRSRSASTRRTRASSSTATSSPTTSSSAARARETP